MNKTKNVRRRKQLQKAAQAEADRVAQEEAKCVIERAQLEEEELAVQKNISGSCKKWQKRRKHARRSCPKYRQHQNKWKEHLGLKA